MKTVWIFLGRTLFWASWPLLFFYLRIGRRTRVIMENNGRILVVKGWLGSGKWQLPGGGLRRGEEPLDGLIREVKEEAGITINSASVKYLGEGKTNNQGLSFKYEAFVVSISEQTSLVPRGIEILEAGWLPVSALNSDNSSSDLLEIVNLWRHP